MNSQISEPLVQRRDLQKKPVDRVIQLHQLYQLQIEHALKYLPLILLASLLTTALHQLLRLVLFEKDVHPVEVFFYIAFLFWGHVLTGFNTYYCSIGNFDLHLITSKQKMRRCCLVGQPSELYLNLHIIQFCLFLACHIGGMIISSSWDGLLLVTDLMFMYLTIRQITTPKQTRKELIQLLAQMQRKQTYALQAYIKVKRRQHFEGLQPIQSFFHPQPSSDLYSSHNSSKVGSLSEIDLKLIQTKSNPE